MTEINFTLSDAEHRRFRDCLFATQERLGVTELRHDEFLSMLLDVWQLHVEREGLEPRADRFADEQLVADGGYVLIRPSSTRSDHIFHQPHPDHPEKPRCKVERGGTKAQSYRRRERETLDDRYRLCSYCDPEWSVERDEEDMAAYQLLDDADSLDDLRADGGEPITTHEEAVAAGQQSGKTDRELVTCPKCGEEFGNLPKHLPACDGDAVTDGGTTYRQHKGVMSAVDVDRPDWALNIAVGDEIAFEAPPDGEIRTARVIGFSSHDGEHHGRPVILPDAELRQCFADDPDQIVITQDYYVQEAER